MLKHKIIYLITIVVLISSCKVKQEIPQNKPLLVMPNKFTTRVDSIQSSIPMARQFFKDSILIALIDTALNNNFDLQMTLQKIEIARAGVRLTKGLGKPDLAGNFAIGQRKFGNYTIDGVGNYDTQFSTNINEKQRIPDPIIPDYYLGIQSSWEIDLWGKLKSQKSSAAARLLASEAGRNLVVSELVAQIASAYYELLILDNELDFLEENIILQERAVELTRILKQSGQGNQLGVDLLNAQLLSSKAMKIEVKQEIIEAESKINFLVGRYPQNISRAKIVWANVIPPKLTAGIPSKLLENRPDIKQAEYDLLATNANLFTAKAAFYPSLNITGAMGLQAFKALVFLNPASFAMNTFGGLTAPLANRRQIISDLMAAKAEQKTAYTNYQKTIVNSFTEVYNHLNLIQNTNEMYDLKVQEVDVLRQSINNSSELFRSGRATYIEVITAQKNALQSQIELINLKKRQYSAVIGLYKSLGGGWR
ncbi:RND efflux system, outer membrane lipoprotein, NodT family [Emticicia oligotrophica DSM 17448]|uniref:RND efflux system, outer membrane lipoprotein, NodT family n=1 Tax=Emticicia oligotrophica (strain DSM 17448 / CIP 109782 / MTCC 6937 / GPTSA100-15) TaxID=929562 RepID=A0ABN4AMN5_EMTOG|nr:MULTISPECIES: efflux transporter outer membrane subunit [Emticicia]AFK03603.1 RND efflux system, outer membrane lipoprotein, NodT family [Emticicia oligotrophica DSM 17448]